MKIENTPLMMTIRQVARTGLLSEYALRLMEKQGKLPCIYVGNRCLVNYPLFPYPALELAEVLLQRGVLLHLGLDVRQEALGLFRAVGEDDLIVFIGINRRVDGVLEGERRALRVATRGLDRSAAPIGPGYSRR